MLKFSDMVFQAESNMARIGRDPESADMDNPQGYIFGEVWSVSARSPQGEVYYFAESFDDQYHAEMFATAYNVRASIYKRQNRDDEIDLSKWVFHRYSYGSQAYIENEAEIVAQERFEDEHPY